MHEQAETLLLGVHEELLEMLGGQLPAELAQELHAAPEQGSRLLPPALLPENALARSVAASAALAAVDTMEHQLDALLGRRNVVNEIPLSAAPVTTVGNSAWSPFHTIGGILPDDSGTFVTVKGLFIDPVDLAAKTTIFRAVKRRFS